MNYNKSAINILGVNISLNNKKLVLEKIINFLNSDKQHFIVTPNPEIILYARNNSEYKNILNKADLGVADGFGVKLAGLTFKKNIPRITGADLLIDILKIAENNNHKVLILNWKKSLSSCKKIENTIIKKFPKLIFKIIESDRGAGVGMANKINDFSPRIALITLGAPYQEEFIYNNLKSFPSVKLAIGIGGAFDFFTGHIKRAPKLIRYLGLEWLFRIFQEKGKRKLWRLKRIYHAVIVFSFKFIKWRIFTKHEKTI